jgi:putative hydrolase of HD superfamily
MSETTERGQIRASRRLTGRLDQQIRFVAEIDRLKGVLRQTMLAGPARRENSAEHSWHLAVMALTLAEHAPAGTDIGRVTAMLLLHDLVEIDAGDLFAYADEAQQARQEVAERAAPAGPVNQFPQPVG